MTQSPGVPLLQDVEPPENMVRSHVSLPFGHSGGGIQGPSAFCLEGTGLLSLSKRVAEDQGGSSSRGAAPQVVCGTRWRVSS